MKVYKDDVGKAVGAAYKKWMDILNSSNPNPIHIGNDFWKNVAEDAIEMIKTTSKVMQEFDKEKSEAKDKD